MSDSSNPYHPGYTGAAAIPTGEATSAVNPYDPTPVSPPPGPDPYSTLNTAGRMATDAVFGLPDLAITAHNLGLTPSAYVAEKVQKLTGRALPDIPPIAPAVRGLLGIQELPEDASIKRTIGEGVGSGVLGGAVPGLARGAVKSVAAIPGAIERRLPRLIDTVTAPGALKEAADTAYTAARSLDVRYNPDTLSNIAGDANFAISKLPQGVTDLNAPTTFAHLDRMANATPPSGAPFVPGTAHLTINDLEKQRQVFNGVRADWRLSPQDRAAAGQVVRSIDGFLENTPTSAIHPHSLNDPALASQLLKEGRGNWAASERLDFPRGVEHAADVRGAAGSVTGREAREVGNIRNRIASTIAASEDPSGYLRGPLYGFNQPEVGALKNVSEGSRANRILRAVSENLAPTTLNPMRLATAGTAATLAGGGGYYGSGGDWSSAALGAAPAAAGSFARWAANQGTRAALKRAEETIATRSPMAASLGISPSATPALPATAQRRAAIAAAIAAAPSSQWMQRGIGNVRNWLNQGYGTEDNAP